MFNFIVWYSFIVWKFGSFWKVNWSICFCCWFIFFGNVKLLGNFSWLLLKWWLCWIMGGIGLCGWCNWGEILFMWCFCLKNCLWIICVFKKWCRFLEVISLIIIFVCFLLGMWMMKCGNLFGWYWSCKWIFIVFWYIVYEYVWRCSCWVCFFVLLVVLWLVCVFFLEIVSCIGNGFCWYIEWW